MKLFEKLKSLFSNSIVSNMALLLVVYSGIRIIFFVFHHEEFSGDSWGALFRAFFTGIRFDLAAIAFSNIPYLALTLLPAKITDRSSFQSFLKGIFLSCNVVILAFMVADIRYYQFTGSRITADVFLLKSEAAAQSMQLLLNYWYLLLIYVPAVVVLLRYYRENTSLTISSRPLLKSILIKFATVALTVIAARGGVQLKPLKPLHAFTTGDQELGILSLNSGFTLIRSHLDSGLKSISDFADEREVEAILAQKQVPEIRDVKKQNVVILILESCATEFIGSANGGKGYTPFLDSLAEKGLLFKNNFANGRRSMEGLPSVLFGVPSLMPTPIAQSNFQTNRWVGLGQLLAAEGYRTSFFHGAKSGTMYFDGISRSAGMTDYVTIEKYPEARRDFDGAWGIYDEPFLQFWAGNLTQQAEPFFSVVFTLSSHQPYQVPHHLKDRFPKGEMKIHQSIQYVDYSVRKFFETVEKTDWYQNTLFVFTGDHTQETKSINYDTTLGRYMVPLMFFHPGKKFETVDRNRITQHADIFPSVLHFLGINAGRRPLFGRSVFGDDEGEAVISANSMDWIVSHRGVVQRDPENRFVYSSYKGKDTKFHKSMEATADTEVLKKRLMAYRQHFNNGLIKNTFFRDPKEKSR